MEHCDALTGLASHTYFQLALRDRIERADQDNGSVCLALLDLDYFRTFNETHGHLEGDQLLLWVGDLLRAELEDGETASRFGGDEFTLLLNAGSVAGMTRRMEHLRGLVEQDPRLITVSIGIATYPRDARDVIGLLKTLDDALYVAKRGGRNLVCLSKSYEERIVKPIRDDGDEGATKYRPRRDPSFRLVRWRLGETAGITCEPESLACLGTIGSELWRA